MKPKFLAPLVIALFVGFPVAAAESAKEGGKIVVEGKKVVELADGGSIVIDAKGQTYHTDAKGKRVRMKDGVVMEGKDGAKGTLSPNR